MKRTHPAIVIFLFFLGWVFMYADRNILSPVMGEIGEQWNLNNAQLGLMSTVFFITYAVMQIPTGFLADRFGRVKVLVIGYTFIWHYHFFERIGIFFCYVFVDACFNGYWRRNLLQFAIRNFFQHYP